MTATSQISLRSDDTKKQQGPNYFETRDGEAQVSLNGLVASQAVTEVLQLLTGFGGSGLRRRDVASMSSRIFSVASASSTASGARWTTGVPGTWSRHMSDRSVTSLSFLSARSPAGCHR